MIAGANDFMMAVRVRSEKFKLDIALNIIFAKVGWAYLDWIPSNSWTLSRLFSLRLEDWSQLILG